MLSLVVTQDVLLESQGTAHAAQSSDLFGIGLGTVAVIIGLWMLLRRKWTVAPNFNGRTDWCGSKCKGAWYNGRMSIQPGSVPRRNV